MVTSFSVPSDTTIRLVIVLYSAGTGMSLVLASWSNTFSVPSETLILSLFQPYLAGKNAFVKHCPGNEIFKILLYILLIFYVKKITII